MTASETRAIMNRYNRDQAGGPGPEAGPASPAREPGLGGAGLALPGEDAVEVRRRAVAFQAELAPKTELGRDLARRAAYLSTRLARCERAEVAATAERVRDAAINFDHRQLDGVERLVQMLAGDPAGCVRRLRVTPAGVEWLIGNWTDLKLDLLDDEHDRWTHHHINRVDNLLGLHPDNFRPTRVQALSSACRGEFRDLDAADGPGLGAEDRATWAFRELVRIIDAEVDALKTHLATMDTTTLAQNRAEADERALFDPSREATLARRFEAATERNLYRALRELRQVEAEAKIQGAEAPPETKGRGSLASFRSDGLGAEMDPEASTPACGSTPRLAHPAGHPVASTGPEARAKPGNPAFTPH